ncbi:MAG: hypothetical protein EA350_05305 [Gemmatimonadales bacterium]|nr:MAG: hypothetical protein EA350_05305 [Gemmatimonadales bacterium]
MGMDLRLGVEVGDSSTMPPRRVRLQPLATIVYGIPLGLVTGSAGWLIGPCSTARSVGDGFDSRSRVMMARGTFATTP